MAANRYKKVEFAVADTNTFLPLADASVDVVLDIFAPRNATEFRRVVRPGGRLVVVIPAPDHLAELRTVVPMLGIETEKRRMVEETFKGRFNLALAQELAVAMELDEPAARDLVAMTPSARHGAERRAAGIDTGMRVTARFEILVFE